MNRRTFLAILAAVVARPAQALSPVNVEFDVLDVTKVDVFDWTQWNERRPNGSVIALTFKGHPAVWDADLPLTYTFWREQSRG